jgi:hypothetical protein
MIGSGISDKARLQAVSWVEPSGAVLRRDVYLGSSKLRFNRLSDEAANKIGQQLFEDIVDLGEVAPVEGKVETINLPSLRSFNLPVVSQGR